MAASIGIGRIFGIPIRLHITFLLIFPLFVYIFSDPSNQTTFLGMPMSFKDMDAPTLDKYIMGAIAAVLFFAGILAHEIAHSYLALKYGVKIKSITLMIFGGVSAMEEMPRQPGQEWRMAFAGPFTSLMIGAVSWALMLVFKLGDTSSTSAYAVVTLLGMMAFYNVLLAGFNLIPAFPMDGGRLLRSFYARRMPYMEATIRAARIGRYFAIAMGIFGLFYNFFFILIALFVYIGATEEEQATTVTESLQGKTVRQLMSSPVQVVHPDMSVQQLHDLMLSTRFMGFPVVDNGLVGIVTLTDTQKHPRNQLQTIRVRDIMTRNVVTVTPDMDAAKALSIMTQKKISRLVVMEGTTITGIVTQRDFLRAINIAVVRSRSPQTAFFQPPPPEGPQQPPNAPF
jgi:Zn-dependent protease/predicted transcriptional regulator